MHRTGLDNGVRVVTEYMPQVRSLAIGFWFDTGSRDESQEHAGVSHFLEHMSFKGTSKRSAAAIVREIEGRGGVLNAFTSKEITCFHARILDAHLRHTVDVLSDISLHSTFNPLDIDRERSVILEELKNMEDTPDELVFEQFIAQIYDSHPMGRPVVGLRESLAAIDRNTLIDYRDARYSGSRVVIAAAGNVDHDRLAGMIHSRFEMGSSDVNVRRKPKPKKPGKYPQVNHTTTQQAHICWGCQSFAYADPRKYTLLVMNTLLGGGMSARLFQHIREKRGLAYSVYSFLDSYYDTGIFGIYAGTEPAKADLTLRLIEKEISDLLHKPISPRELKRTKDQLKGNLMLGCESPNSRMHRLAKMEIYTGERLTLDEVIELIDAVTAADVRNAAADLFDNKAIYTTMLLPH